MEPSNLVEYYFSSDEYYDSEYETNVAASNESQSHPQALPDVLNEPESHPSQAITSITTNCKKNRTSFSEFLKFDTCTIIGTIDVLDEFDNNNNIIGEDKDVAVDTGGDVKLDAVNEDAIVDDEEWKQNVNVKQTREDIERGGTQHRRDVRKLAPICNKKIDQILSDLPE
eukprot:938436_1